MQTEQSILRVTVRVVAATAARRFVTATGGAPTAGSNALGPVYMATSAANQRTAVTVLGAVPVETSAAVVAGSALEVTATGQVKMRTGTNTIVARALTATTSAGTIRAVIVPN